MKATCSSTITFLCALLLILSVTAASHVAEVDKMYLGQTKEYNWIWDIVMWLFDTIILAVIGPFFFFASLFANCQTCYSDFVIGFMNTPFLRLSYKYI